MPNLVDHFDGRDPAGNIVEILLRDTSTLNFANQINNNLTTLTSNVGTLSDLATSDKTSIVNAINEVRGDVGNRQDLITTDKSTIVGAVNEVKSGVTGNAMNIGDPQDLNTTDKSTLVGAINEVLSKTQPQGRYIFITDSYGGNPSSSTSWIDYLVGYLGLSAGNYYDFWEGGSAFTQTTSPYHNFLEVLQANVSSVSHPETITHVVLCAGYNDAPAVWGTLANLDSAMQSFITYCKNTFPIADIYIGMIGRNSINSEILSELGVVAEYYKHCESMGAIYLNGVENSLHKDIYIQGDGIHPTTAGSESIAKSVYQALLTGFGDVDIPFDSVTTTPASGVQLNSWYLQTCTKNDITSLFFNCWPNNYMQIIFTTPINISATWGSDIITLGSLSNTCITGGYNERTRAQVTGVVYDQNSNATVCGIQFEIVDKSLIMRVFAPAAISNVTAVIVTPFTQTFVSSQC